MLTQPLLACSFSIFHFWHNKNSLQSSFNVFWIKLENKPPVHLRTRDYLMVEKRANKSRSFFFQFDGCVCVCVPFAVCLGVDITKLYLVLCLLNCICIFRALAHFAILVKIFWLKRASTMNDERDAKKKAQNNKILHNFIKKPKR